MKDLHFMMYLFLGFALSISGIGLNTLAFWVILALVLAVDFISFSRATE